MKLRAVAAFALVLVASNAEAAVPRLDPQAAAALRAEIQRARAADTSPFVKVNDIVTQAAPAHAAARGQRAPVAQTLARLGPAATLPILELLAVDAPKGVPAAAAPIVRRDLIEATGLLADARALPVLAAMLRDAGEDVDATRTTAEAVARIGTPASATHLTEALAAAAPDRARAIVAGMGECRRLVVTQAIAARLASGADDAMVRAATRSLGRAGSAWVWKTLPDKSEEAKIRETAARALVSAFVQHEGAARDAASNALMVVDAPLTPTLIADARRGAAPGVQAALDALAARFANNPSR